VLAPVVLNQPSLGLMEFGLACQLERGGNSKEDPKGTIASGAYPHPLHVLGGGIRELTSEVYTQTISQNLTQILFFLNFL
jgi:hypothetical protein